MYCRRLFLGLVAGAVVFAIPGSGRAVLIYSTADMGATAGSGGLTLAQFYYVGANFTLGSETTIDGIGGNFYGTQLFGAIVKLTSLTDFPDVIHQPSADVLAYTVFNGTNPSSDMVVPIGPITVPAGYYSVVFGSGILGASVSGVGGLVGGNPVPGGTTPTFIRHQEAGGWTYLSNNGYRLTVYATPEPSALVIVSLALPVVGVAVRRRLHGK